MDAKEIRDDRKYTKDHEWAQLQDGELVVGITAFAVDQLGDITLVNFDVDKGDSIEAGKAFGTIESVKTLSDLFAPVSGKVVSLNPQLEDSPELINTDCYGAGWMIRIACDANAIDDLMDAEAYAEHVTESEH